MLHTYRITYRKLDGSTAYAMIHATSPENAMLAFYGQYDGRIITVDIAVTAWQHVA